MMNAKGLSGEGCTFIPIANVLPLVKAMGKDSLPIELFSCSKVPFRERGQAPEFCVQAEEEKIYVSVVRSCALEEGECSDVKDSSLRARQRVRARE